jgi:hypothetical protein
VRFGVGASDKIQLFEKAEQTSENVKQADVKKKKKKKDKKLIDD